jgi:lysophospholipase L1-like esterase
MRYLLLALCLICPLSVRAILIDHAQTAQSSLTPVTQQREIYGDVSWLERHEQILERNKTVKPELVFLGDSITHFWSGEPLSYRPTDAASWKTASNGLVVTNLGYGFDYIENALWRVQHGELDGISPKLIVINIGTNNLGHKGDNPEACERGMKALLSEVRTKQPAAKILLLGIYPRHETKLADAIVDTNHRYSKLANNDVTFLDINEALTEPDKGSAPSPLLFRDGLHPNAAGYAVIAEKLAPIIYKLTRVVQVSN